MMIVISFFPLCTRKKNLLKCRCSKQEKLENVFGPQHISQCVLQSRGSISSSSGRTYTREPNESHTPTPHLTRIILTGIIPWALGMTPHPTKNTLRSLVIFITMVHIQHKENNPAITHKKE
jgi:hypothetical protein